MGHKFQKNVFIVISALLILVVVFGFIIGCGKETENKRIVDELETTIRHLRSNNLELGERIDELENSEQRLKDRITEQRDIIERIEGNAGKLRDANTGIREDIEELEKLIFEIFGD